MFAFKTIHRTNMIFFLVHAKHSTRIYLKLRKDIVTLFEHNNNNTNPTMEYKILYGQFIPFKFFKYVRAVVKDIHTKI